MDFGLGLILSFTDNASAGMNSAVQSLNNLTSVAESASNSMSSLDRTVSLMATAQSANMIGNSLIGAGKNMLSLFQGLIGRTQQLGSEYENFGVTLGALGMNAEDSIKKLFDFANHSPLEVGDVKDMIVTLQAQGINAFEKTTGAISGTRQEFLAYLTDLKSFKPEVIGQRFNMAIQNYVGSGEKKMMRTVFDMGDIEQIIGHKVSDTAEGRMQDIVEMVEKKGLTGLSEKMSKTWSGVQSNISDAFTRIYYSVANDGGVFDKLKNSFMGLASVIIDLPDEDLKFFGKTIGDALNTLVTPLTKVINWFTKFIKSAINLSKTHPKLVKMGIILTTIAGGGLVLSGVMMKLIGSLASFIIVMDRAGGTVGKVASMFKSSLGGMALSIGLLAIAWKTDFGGIRTMTTEFLTNLTNSFKTAKSAVEGSVQGLSYTLDSLKEKDDFWSSITIGFMKIYGAFKFVAEAWKDNNLSEDSFLKAKELGILPLIEAVLDLKYRFEFFKKGFIEGWREISNKVKSFIDKITSSVKGTPIETLTDKFTSFLHLFSTGDAKNFENAGKVFAKITATFLAMRLVPKILGGVISKLSIFTSLGKGVGGAFSRIFSIFGGSSGGSSEGGAVGSITSRFSGLDPKATLKTMESVAIIVGGVGLIVVALGLLAKIPYFNTFLISGVTTITKLAVAILPLSLIAIATSGVLKAVSTLGGNVTSVAKGMGSIAIILGGIASVVYALGAISSIPYFNKFLSQGVNTLVSLAKAIFPIALVTVAFAGVSKVMGMLGADVKTIAKGLANIAIILGGMEVLVTAMGALVSIPYFSTFLNKGVSVVSGITNVLKSMADFKLGIALLGLVVFGLVPVSTVAKGLANLAIVFGGMELLITAMGALSSIPYFGDFLSKGTPIFSSITNTLMGMGNAQFLLALAGISALGFVPIKAVLFGIANLALIIGGMTLIIEAFGLLSQIPYFTEFLQTGGDTLALLFRQIGKIAGSVIGGIAEGVTDALPEIGNNLAKFGNNIKPLFSAVQNAPLSELGDFGKGMGALIAALAVDKITSIIGGDIDLAELGKQLSSFSVSAKTFFNNIKDYPEDGISKAPKIMEAISGVGAYAFRSDGIAQLFTGEVDLEEIGEQLSGFSKTAVTFFRNIEKYPQGGIDKAPKVLEAIDGIGDYDFKSGGLAQLFTGSTDISDIGEQLSDFSETANAFFTWVNGISDSTVARVTTILKSFEVLSNFKSGGLAQLITGDVNLENIGEQLSKFSETSGTFYSKVEDISYGAISKSESMFKSLGSTTSFRNGGLIELFIGEVDLPNLGTQLSQFATNVEPFFTKMADLDESSFGTAKKLFESMTYVKPLVEVAKTSNGNLSSFGKELVSFANSINKFAGKTKGTADLSSVFGRLKKGMKSFVNTINSNSSSIESGMTSITNSISKASKTGSSKFKALTTNANNFATGVKSSVSSVSSSLKTLQSSFNNLKIKFPNFKVPEITTSGKFDLKAEPPTAPKFKLSWHKDGGIFDSPSVIGVGEAGREAVVPLENNLGWLDNLASMLSNRLINLENVSPNIQQGMSSTNITRNVSNNTTSNTTNTTKQGNTDNSIHFEKGSIVIEAKDFSVDEAERFAKMIMDKIKRQKEVNSMLNYGM